MKHFYMADTETTTGAYNENKTKVWAWAACEIGYEDTKRWYGSDIDSLMKWCEAHPTKLFFHNLKFDGEFIIYWLLTHGYTFNSSNYNKPHTFKSIISKMMQWYQIDICFARKGKKIKHLIIQDSYKKLPFPVRAISSAFDIEEHKTSLDYDLNPDNSEWLKDEKKKEYVSNDVTIVSKALKMQFDKGMSKMTIGADSLNSYRKMIGAPKFKALFPELPPEVDDDIRKAYRGGFVWCNPRFAGQTINGGRVYDVNSLYPSRMRYCLLPYGAPKIFVGEYEKDEMYPLYIQSMRCEFKIKKDHIPTIQLKNSGRFANNEYLTSSGKESVILNLSSVDLEVFFRHYDVWNIEYFGGYKFAAKKGMFDKWIDERMEIKMHVKGVKRTLAKLELNNLYGKFATSLDVTRKEPYIGDDKALHFKTMEKETTSGLYIPMGVFITAWARKYTIDTAQNVFDRILYCDTDSIHIKDDTMPKAIEHLIDPVKLGYWKHESTFLRGKFIRAKTYIEDIDGSQNELKVHDKCSYPAWTDQDKEVTKCFDTNQLEICERNKNTKERATYYELNNDKVVKASYVYHIHIRCAGMQDKTRQKVTWENFNFGFIDQTGKLRPKHVQGGVILVNSPFRILRSK